MRYLAIFLLLLPSLLFSQTRDSVLIKSKIYEIVYSEVLEQPKYVKYKVLCTEGKESRAGLDFYTEPKIHTSSNEDYAKNEYDKGHMAPAADFNCSKEYLKLTFSYLNCALQEQHLNRGVWKELESRERELAKTDEVTVVIIVLFDKKSVKLSTGSTVPTGFYKIIQLKKAKLTYKYYFPNKRPELKSIEDYRIK